MRNDHKNATLWANQVEVSETEGHLIQFESSFARGSVSTCMWLREWKIWEQLDVGQCAAEAELIEIQGIPRTDS